MNEIWIVNKIIFGDEGEYIKLLGAFSSREKARKFCASWLRNNRLNDLFYDDYEIIKIGIDKCV